MANPAITQAELARDLKDHPTKLTAAFALLQVIGMSQPGPVAAAFRRAAELAPKAHQAKLRGFYVDVAADGTYTTPADVTECEATELIRDLGVVVDVLPPWLTEGALDKLNELAGPHADKFREVATLGGHLAAVDSEKAAELVRDMLLRGRVPEVDPEAK